MGLSSEEGRILSGRDLGARAPRSQSQLPQPACVAEFWRIPLRPRLRKQTLILHAAPATLGAAEDAEKHNVQNVLGLCLGRLALAGEIIREQDAIHQIAKDVGDAFG